MSRGHAVVPVRDAIGDEADLELEVLLSMLELDDMLRRQLRVRRRRSKGVGQSGYKIS